MIFPPRIRMNSLTAPACLVALALLIQTLFSPSHAAGRNRVSLSEGVLRHTNAEAEAICLDFRICDSSSDISLGTQNVRQFAENLLSSAGVITSSPSQYFSIRTFSTNQCWKGCISCCARSFALKVRVPLLTTAPVDLLGHLASWAENNFHAQSTLLPAAVCVRQPSMAAVAFSQCEFKSNMEGAVEVVDSSTAQPLATAGAPGLLVEKVAFGEAIHTTAFPGDDTGREVDVEQVPETIQGTKHGRDVLQVVSTYGPPPPGYYYGGSPPPPGQYGLYSPPPPPTYIPPAYPPSYGPSTPPPNVTPGPPGYNSFTGPPVLLSDTTNKAGVCYCPYDLDWKSWALGDQTCRASLYNKCGSDGRLPCSWLDSFFDPASPDGFMKSHQKDISDYLYQDCPPAAPCTCSSIDFNSTTTSTQTMYDCCRSLQVWCQVPFSGLDCLDVDSYCGNSKSSASDVEAWVKHTTWHVDCASQPAGQLPYTNKVASNTTTSATRQSSARSVNTVQWAVPLGVGLTLAVVAVGALVVRHRALAARQGEQLWAPLHH